MTEPDWPVPLDGITETVVTTPGPTGRWNVAALGLRADEAVTARTWGRTRTRRSFERVGRGVIQFTTDPVTFVDAALAAREVDDPILPGAVAWTRVTVDRVDSGDDGGTEWVEWRVDPTETVIEERTVPTINRGYNAVIEATVAASRLDVDAYDRSTLVDRLAHHSSVIEQCGGARERAALDRLRELASW